MAYSIVYKAYAERDIWEIAEYISRDSMPGAAKFLQTMKKQIENLMDMPLMYPNVILHQEYRKMVVGNVNHPLKIMAW